MDDDGHFDESNEQGDAETQAQAQTKRQAVALLWGGGLYRHAGSSDAISRGKCAGGKFADEAVGERCNVVVGLCGSGSVMGLKRSLAPLLAALALVGITVLLLYVGMLVPMCGLFLRESFWSWSCWILSSLPLRPSLHGTAGCANEVLVSSLVLILGLAQPTREVRCPRLVLACSPSCCCCLG